MNECGEQAHVHASSRCPCRPVVRKSHKKSRNGCQNCKKRRVKPYQCDENKPTCKNCTRSSIPCDFSADSNTLVPVESAASSSTAKGPRKLGRPLKKWAWGPDIPRDRETRTKTAPPSLPTLESPPLPLPLNVDDIQLFHHYITVTSLTLGDNVLWRDKVPRLAFEHHYILHLMLSLSALHLARLHVAAASRYRDLAEAHHSIALPQVTSLLPQISRNNCSALYIATVLVCNYTFAKPPTENHLLVVADSSEVAFWNLFRGVRFVIETMGLPAIFTGHIGPFPPPVNTTAVPSTEGDNGYIPWEWPLNRLEERLLACQDPGLENLAVICEALMDCFKGVYGTTEQPESTTHGKLHVVMRWLWYLEDDFIIQIQNLVPEALVLLAHFAVLVQTVECFWFMRGWAHHVLDGVVKQLDSGYITWISWPQKQLESQCDHNLHMAY
ncbi:unnamed protein product [Clonostachys byssicola]|uniref:Zn(2)-C6 fungal-type domain-containing protein n=1 Tax=Clonostachys byssicola TaxID=160290 RepID=A0A9N9UV12_9HYPO|nr:unnamed protein product [Clonostachys byssicola]